MYILVTLKFLWFWWFDSNWLIFFLPFTKSVAILWVNKFCEIENLQNFEFEFKNKLIQLRKKLRDKVLPYWITQKKSEDKLQVRPHLWSSVRWIWSRLREYNVYFFRYKDIFEPHQGFYKYVTHQNSSKTFEILKENIIVT